MQAIKALVIFMGILILGGLVLLGYGMYSKAGRSVKPSSPTVVATPAPAASVALSAFGDVALDQPAGSRIQGARVSGGTLVVEVTEGGRPDRVVLVDLTSGGVIGIVHLGAAPAPVEAPTAQ